MLDGRRADGRLVAHLYREAAELAAGGPLEQFGTHQTEPDFASGQAMNAADFRRDLERLAGRS